MGSVSTETGTVIIECKVSVRSGKRREYVSGDFANDGKGVLMLQM